jgi:LacI family repressor for deo operon, udp, cdd, tsx, nupC, and nupG
VPVIDELIVENAWTKELGAEGTRKLLSLPQPPDAIFASTSDFSALGVLDVANAMKYQSTIRTGDLWLRQRKLFGDYQSIHNHYRSV